MDRIYRTIMEKHREIKFVYSRDMRAMERKSE
jgi:hypothetical protein